MIERENPRRNHTNGFLQFFIPQGMIDGGQMSDWGGGGWEMIWKTGGDLAAHTRLLRQQFRFKSRPRV